MSGWWEISGDLKGREGNHVLLFILLHELAEFKDMR